jgi:hypothetical protein
MQREAQTGGGRARPGARRQRASEDFLEELRRDVANQVSEHAELERLRAEVAKLGPLVTEQAAEIKRHPRQTTEDRRRPAAEAAVRPRVNPRGGDPRTLSLAPQF